MSAEHKDHPNPGIKRQQIANIIKIMSTKLEIGFNSSKNLENKTICIMGKIWNKSLQEFCHSRKQPKIFPPYLLD